MAESFKRLPCDGPKAFICECGAIGCTARVSLALPEYHAIRAHPARLALAPGHVVPVHDVFERSGRVLVETPA